MKHGEQLQMAKMAGCTNSFLGMILAGKRRPRWDRAKDMGERLGLDPVLLVDGDPAEIEEALDEIIEAEKKKESGVSRETSETPAGEDNRGR